MKTIIVIQRPQFGYFSDYYYYAKYLSSIFKFRFICWDFGRKKIMLDGVEVKYLSKNGNVLIKNIRFLLFIIKFLQNQTYDVVFVKHFLGCSIIPFFSKSGTILDVRSGAIRANSLIRFIHNRIITLESRFFSHTTVIAGELRDFLKIKAQSSSVLPVGADLLALRKKEFNQFRLLYVGTLFNRNIEQTIIGFSDFLKQTGDTYDILYTIIGSGPGTELKELKNLVLRLNLEDKVLIKGYIPLTEIKDFFENCNIGVSYIPVTSYFDLQPPTKTYEYLLSGMPVLATKTTANKKIITEKNGVLISDSAAGFSNGLKQIIAVHSTYQSENIMHSVKQNTWENIATTFNSIIRRQLGEPGKE